mgnify:FL=1
MLKKKIILLSAALPLAVSSFVMADKVVGQSTDKTAGKTLGGFSTFLIGGAAGGPVGAIVAGLAGAWAGGEIQEANNASGNTYQIRKTDGELVDLRSPNHTFAIGDEVIIQGIRPLPLVTLSSNSKKLSL